MHLEGSDEDGTFLCNVVSDRPIVEFRYAPPSDYERRIPQIVCDNGINISLSRSESGQILKGWSQDKGQGAEDELT